MPRLRTENKNRTGPWVVLAVLGLILAGGSLRAWGQTGAAADNTSQSGTKLGGAAASSAVQAGAQTSQEVVPLPAAKRFYTVPAGTKVLLQLRSPINTRNARPGDGVYLASTFPVVVGTRVMIPSGVYVQGVVDSVVRAGRIKGRAQLNMHFSSIIFPNGTVAEVPGVVSGLPGARNQDVKDNGEGTIEEKSDKGRDAGRVAEIGAPTGGTIGTLGGLAAGHPVAGGIIGVAAGLGAAGVVALFTRGQDVDIESGTTVEMVLQQPLQLEEAKLSVTVPEGAVAAGFVPVAAQAKPMEKPTAARPRILCPMGGLGCQ